MPFSENDEIKYEIVENYAVLSESGNGWTVEFNKVSWNGKEPKYDIRRWSPNRERPGKGISLTGEEMSYLIDAISGVSIE